MGFADAWYDGGVTFEGVEAKRCDRRKDLLAGLRSRQFIPILPGGFDEVTARWPWDVIVDARATMRRRPGIATYSGAYTGVVDTFYHVEDHSDAWVTTGTLVTYRYQKMVKEGKYHLQEGADFAQDGGYFVQDSYRFETFGYTEKREKSFAGLWHVPGNGKRYGWPQS